MALIVALLAIVANAAFAPDFLADFASAQTIEQPGVFIGQEWTCGEESCYAGLLWIISDDGQGRVPSLETGP